jgi:hypothetical protein
MTDIIQYPDYLIENEPITDDIINRTLINNCIDNNNFINDNISHYIDILDNYINNISSLVTEFCYYHDQFGLIPSEIDFNNIIYAIEHNKIIYQRTDDSYILNIIEKTDNSDADKPKLPILSIDFITGISL